MKIIRDECEGSGGITVTSAEAVQGSVRCSRCGRTIKIRAKAGGAATMPRHSRKENHKKELPLTSH